MRQLVKLQDEVEVAYSRIVSVTVDTREVIAAFRAGLGTRWTILSDPERVYQRELDLLETTDTINRPYIPYTFTLYPDLTIHRIYNGYWFWGRATMEELRQDMREITRRIRPDFDLQKVNSSPPPAGGIAERPKQG
jgi:hypothetical protein